MTKELVSVKPIILLKTEVFYVIRLTKFRGHLYETLAFVLLKEQN